MAKPSSNMQIILAIMIMGGSLTTTFGFFINYLYSTNIGHLISVIGFTIAIAGYLINRNIWSRKE